MNAPPLILPRLGYFVQTCVLAVHLEKYARESLICRPRSAAAAACLPQIETHAPIGKTWPFWYAHIFAEIIPPPPPTPIHSIGWCGHARPVYQNAGAECVATTPIHKTDFSLVCASHPTAVLHYSLLVQQRQFDSPPPCLKIPWKSMSKHVKTTCLC